MNVFNVRFLIPTTFFFSCFLRFLFILWLFVCGLCQKASSWFLFNNFVIFNLYYFFNFKFYKLGFWFREWYWAISYLRVPQYPFSEAFFITPSIFAVDFPSDFFANRLIYFGCWFFFNRCFFVVIPNSWLLLKEKGLNFGYWFCSGWICNIGELFWCYMRFDDNCRVHSVFEVLSSVVTVFLEEFGSVMHVWCCIFRVCQGIVVSLLFLVVNHMTVNKSRSRILFPRIDFRRTPFRSFLRPGGLRW